MYMHDDGQGDMSHISCVEVLAGRNVRQKGHGGDSYWYAEVDGESSDESNKGAGRLPEQIE